MEVIYGLIPGMILLGIVMLVVLFWAVRSGQYDDPDGSANRILMDDDDPLLPNSQQESTEESEED
jgi:cbb3-type cytochrome oxidase maturation protein